MSIEDLFRSFSWRSRKPRPLQYTIPRTIRTKVHEACLSYFSRRSVYGPRNWDPPIDNVWKFTKKTALLRYGELPILTRNGRARLPEDLREYLWAASDEQFLDFLEDLFVPPLPSFSGFDPREFVRVLNVLLNSEDIGYELTPFSLDDDGEVTALPQIVRRDSRLTNELITAPVLELLADARFQNANNEYRGALEDFRHLRYGDCVVKCCSAFESCLKIICHIKKWQYKQEDTAGPLVNIVIKNGRIDPYLTQTFVLVATLRNKKGPAHGAGIMERDARQEDAQFALDLSATAIKYIIALTLRA